MYIRAQIASITNVAWLRVNGILLERPLAVLHTKPRIRLGDEVKTRHVRRVLLIKPERSEPEWLQ